MGYAELLRDPRWQRRRLEVLKQADFKCQECGDESTELHVHHHYYISGWKPWDYPDTLLTVLCKDCHKAVEIDKEVLLGSFSNSHTVGGAGGVELAREARSNAITLCGFAVNFAMYGDNYPFGDAEYNAAYVEFAKAVEKFIAASRAYDAR